MRSALLALGLLAAVCAAADACPVRYDSLTAQEKEAMREQIRRLEAAGLLDVPRSESSSHALELGVAALCLVSLFALRRSRPADPVSSHAG